MDHTLSSRNEYNSLALELYDKLVLYKLAPSIYQKTKPFSFVQSEPVGQLNEHLNVTWSLLALESLVPVTGLIAAVLSNLLKSNEMGTHPGWKPVSEAWPLGHASIWMSKPKIKI
jgi:hypothetical protein